MSTLKVSTIQNAATTAGGISIDSSGAVSGGLPTPNRNLLYNGAMQIAQRGTSTASITTASYNTADRWQAEVYTTGTWTNSIENDAPTGSGFAKSFKMLCTTADASPAAGDALLVSQTLEGQDLQRICKGTSAAQELTMSFWVKSNVTGTFIVELMDNDNTRRVSASYTISASATWEYKTITFPADTVGSFDNDNAGSMPVNFWLSSGSNFAGGSPLQTAWGTATNTRATGQTNLAAATNNYWQVTGVQLEVGDTATDFEHLPYGVELARCQRYCLLVAEGSGDYWASGFYGNSTSAVVSVYHPTIMRAVPSASVVSGTNYYICTIGASSDTVNSFSWYAGNEYFTVLLNNTEASGTAASPFYATTNNAASKILLSAEL